MHDGEYLVESLETMECLIKKYTNDLTIANHDGHPGYDRVVKYLISWSEARRLTAQYVVFVIRNDGIDHLSVWDSADSRYYNAPHIPDLVGKDLELWLRLN